METVTEKQVLSQEELETLKTLQTTTQQLILELGEIELIKIQLGERHEVAIKTLNQIQNSEKDFTSQLTEKYGNITLNPTTGEINKID